MVDVPMTAPNTWPEPSTVAIEVVLLLQLPPVAPSVKEVDEPAQTAAAPLIVPADGSGLTVTICVAAAVPQLFVTE